MRHCQIVYQGYPSNDDLRYSSYRRREKGQGRLISRIRVHDSLATHFHSRLLSFDVNHIKNVLYQYYFNTVSSVVMNYVE